MSCRHAQVAGKQLVFITVRNTCTRTVLLQGLTVECYQQFKDRSPTGDSLLDAEDEDIFCGDGIKVVSVCLPQQERAVMLHWMESHCYHGHLEINAEKITEPQVWQLSACLRWETSVLSTSWDKEERCDISVSQYHLMDVSIRKPQLVITAHPESNLFCHHRFNMKYTIKNNLTEFMSLRLMWNPAKALQDTKAQESDSYMRSIGNVMNSVVCHQPSLSLGSCSVGSTVSGAVAFTLLNPGLYELGQHMKLNLQYSVRSRPHGDLPRRDSLTSIRSMPTDLLPSSSYRTDATGAHKSASMCPLSLDGAEDVSRADSLSSLRGMSGSAGTPTEYSPHHTPSLHTARQTGPLSAYRPAPFSSPVRSTATDVASNASQSSISMTAAITPRQVLKRNCQVYVTQDSRRDADVHIGDSEDLEDTGIHIEMIPGHVNNGCKYDPQVQGTDYVGEIFTRKKNAENFTSQGEITNNSNKMEIINSATLSKKDDNTVDTDVHKELTEKGFVQEINTIQHVSDQECENCNGREEDAEIIYTEMTKSNPYLVQDEEETVHDLRDYADYISSLQKSHEENIHMVKQSGEGLEVAHSEHMEDANE